MEETIARIQVAWELKQVGQRAEYIAERVGVYRWLKGIRQRGVKGYVRHYRNAKKGRRVRKTHAYIEQRVLGLRREYRECCGQKIVYLLEQQGIHLSLSTVYRMLGKHLKLRKHHRTPQGQPIEQAKGPREVIQMDTVDLGEVFAFTAIDTCTKEGQVVMRPSLTAEDGKAALQQIMQAFDHCQVIQTDGANLKPSVLRPSLPLPSTIASLVLTRRMSKPLSSVSMAHYGAKNSVTLLS